MEIEWNEYSIWMVLCVFSDENKIKIPDETETVHIQRLKMN